MNIKKQTNGYQKGTYYFVFNTGRKITSKKTGKLVYQQIKRTGFDTKKEAELAYIALKTKYNLGGNDSNQTFNLFVEEWFELFKRNDTRGMALSKRTSSGYRNILDNHLIPYFGHMPVKTLTPHDVNIFLDQQLLSGLSKRTVQSHYRLLSTITDAIVLRGFLPRNIVKDTKCPVPEKKSKAELESQVLNKREQGLLIKQVNHELENSPDYYTDFAHAFIHLALATGLRLSELLALKWGDIVASTVKDKGEFVYLLKVQRALDIDGSFKAPKSTSGERDIPLDKTLLTTLWAHRDRLNEYKATQDDWSENDLILPYKDGKTNSSKRVPQQIRSLFDRAFIHGSAHTLRHTCITNWLHTVPNIKLVSTLAGHSEVSITLNRYGHVLEENAISELDNLYSTMRSLRT